MYVFTCWYAGGQGILKRLLAVFSGDGMWSSVARAALTTVLLQAGTENLLAQLGFLAKVLLPSSLA